jgi:hypothetical protein
MPCIESHRANRPATNTSVHLLHDTTDQPTKHPQLGAVAKLDTPEIWPIVASYVAKSPQRAMAEQGGRFHDAVLDDSLREI